MNHTPETAPTPALPEDPVSDAEKEGTPDGEAETASIGEEPAGPPEPEEPDKPEEPGPAESKEPDESADSADPEETPDPEETAEPDEGKEPDEVEAPDGTESEPVRDPEFELLEETDPDAETGKKRRRGKSARRSRRKKILAVCLSLFAVLLIACAGGLWFLTRQIDAALVPVTAGIGETPVIAALNDPVYSRVLKADPPLASVDTSSLGIRRASLTLYRYFEREVEITVIDRCAPEFETWDYRTFAGTPLAPEDFVRSCADQTEVTFSFEEEPDFSAAGEQTVRIEAVDEGGNRTVKEAALHVTDQTIPRELGEKEGLAEAVLEAMPGVTPENLEVSSVDGGTRGLYPVSGASDAEKFLLLVEVRDTTPPEGTPVPLDLLSGSEHLPEEFVKEIADELPVEISFREKPDFDGLGEGTVLLSLEDGAGNRTSLDVPVMVWDLPAYQMIEYGTTPEEILAMVFTSSQDLDGVRLVGGYDSSLKETGRHDIVLEGIYSAFSVVVEMEDTKPPTAVMHDFDLLLGEEVGDGDLLTDLTDYSGAEFTRLTDPDFTKTGVQTVKYRLEDPVGNAAEVEANLKIWQIPREIRAERGSGETALIRALFADCGKDGPPNVESVPDLSAEPGEYEILLSGKFSGMTVSLTIEDTTPPTLRTKNASVWIGGTAGAWDFAAQAEDLSGVTLRLDPVPSADKEGDVPVTLVAADPYGNETRADAVLTVMADHDPPVIYGAEDIKVYLGNTVSFRKNVWAEDARDGAVNVSVDSSAVNLNAAGVYTVTYSASDASGNIGRKSIRVTVTEFDEALVNSLADGVLTRIGAWSGSERDKALAIFNWVSGSIRYSTATSYLMGQYWRAAYSGLTGYTGNCYTYYAVSAVLLTRAGIENVMIQRNIPSRPHYWNLVKIDGNWYHFDTCPHYDGCDLWSFLLTDAEVADYSANVAVDYYSFDPDLYPATP